MPIVYTNYPPTAEDVKYDPNFVPGVNGSHGQESVDDMVMFTIGIEDAQRFAHDIVRDEQGMVNLGEVRRGLALAASELIEAAGVQYTRGVEHYISSCIARLRQ